MNEQQNGQRRYHVNEPIRGAELVSEQMLKKFRRELVITRVMCIITSLLLICLLLGGAYVLRQVQPVLEQATALDVENINETFGQVKSSLENVDLQQAAKTMQQMAEKMENVDLEAWNNAIDGLDTEELSKTLANLNDAVEALRRVEASINSVFGRR
ncbi:MAG: hypothetical protein OSJ73_03825 [Lachnospiraceae bacterium]|nr:hypothetical protein [Lachnospiraceae bacterium]